MPAPMKTRPGLLDWMLEPPPDRGLRLLDADGSWRLSSFTTLADHAARAASFLEHAAPVAGRPVGLMLTTADEFAAALFGTLLAGAIPMPIAPPGPFGSPEEYKAHLARIREVADPALMVTDPGLRDLVGDALGSPRPGVRTLALDLEGVPPIDQPQPRAELALLQFTSGSMGTPKGARVTWANLEANAEMIVRWAGLRADREIASWLPLFHDMGLIGALITPTLIGESVRIMRPEQFIRDPGRWLECMGRHGCAIAVAPTFGFAYAHSRLRQRDLSGMDFSAWQAAICGAERVDSVVLSAFARWLEPHGFHASTFLPAYGLAEATLAVSGGRLGEVPTVAHVEWSELRLCQPVRLAGTAPLGSEDASAAGGLVSCGTPLDGVGVRVVDAGGEPVADGSLGELEVSGPTVVADYVGDSVSAGTRFVADGRLRSGDAGFMHGGELYVLGRMGDSMSVRGRVLYMEDIEARLSTVPGMPPRRSVVVGGEEREGTVLYCFSELQQGDWVEGAMEALRAAVGTAVTIRLFAVPRGAIPRTTSGKPRRHLLWARRDSPALVAHPLVAPESGTSP